MRTARAQGFSKLSPNPMLEHTLDSGNASCMGCYVEFRRYKWPFGCHQVPGGTSGRFAVLAPLKAVMAHPTSLDNPSWDCGGASFWPTNSDFRRFNEYVEEKTPTFDMISVSQAYFFLHPHCSQCLRAGFKYSIRCRLQGGFPSDAPPYPTHTWGEKLMEGLFQAGRKGTGGSGNLPVCNARRCREADPMRILYCKLSIHEHMWVLPSIL